MKRNGSLELKGDMEEIKTDYAAQGQTILMSMYRDFINPQIFCPPGIGGAQPF